jgi:hypothetical protein
VEGVQVIEVMIDACCNSLQFLGVAEFIDSCRDVCWCRRSDSGQPITV